MMQEIVFIAYGKCLHLMTCHLHKFICWAYQNLQSNHVGCRQSIQPLGSVWNVCFWTDGLNEEKIVRIYRNESQFNNVSTKVMDYWCRLTIRTGFTIQQITIIDSSYLRHEQSQIRQFGLVFTSNGVDSDERSRGRPLHVLRLLNVERECNCVFKNTEYYLFINFCVFCFYFFSTAIIFD